MTIDNCCDLNGFPLSTTPSAVYQMKSCIVPCEVSSFTTVTVSNAAYCDMTTDGGGVTLEKCCNVVVTSDVHNHHDPLAFQVRQQSSNVHSFELF